MSYSSGWALRTQGFGGRLRFLGKLAVARSTRLRFLAGDGRRTVEKGVPANFFVYYEIDEDESKHNLTLDEYGQMAELNAWVLLAQEEEM